MISLAASTADSRQPLLRSIMDVIRLELSESYTTWQENVLVIFQSKSKRNILKLYFA